MQNISFPSDCDIENNKYYKWYMCLIHKRLNVFPIDVYCEKHHVIPKCAGGNMANPPIVKLTAREHFIAHLLLPKFVGNILYKKKLIFALWGICNQNSGHQERTVVNSHTYKLTKEAFSKSISGENHWMKDSERRRKLSEKCMGRKLSDETKAKISKKFMGRPITWKDKIGKSNKGKKRTAAMRAVQSAIGKGRVERGEWVSPTQGKIRERHECPHCRKMVDVANLKRWHGDRCKSRK